jgi:hypothetical protein
MMLVLDPNATDGETAAAFADILTTTISSKKLLDKSIANLDENMQEAVKRTYKRSVDLYKEQSKLLLDESSPLREMVLEKTEEMIPKVEETQKVEDVASRSEKIARESIGGLTQRVDEQFGQTRSNATEVYDQAMVRAVELSDRIPTTGELSPRESVSLVYVPIEEITNQTIQKLGTEWVEEELEDQGQEDQDVSTEEGAPEIEGDPVDGEDMVATPPSEVPNDREEESDAPEVVVDAGAPTVDEEQTDRRSGTYSGTIHIVETMFGGADMQDPMTLTVKNGNMVFSGGAQAFGEAVSFTYPVEKTDMAGRMAGVCYIPGNLIVRQDREPVGSHRTVMEVNFHEDQASGKIQLHYGEERFGYLEFEASK